MPIDRADFAIECVTWAEDLGVNSHYLIAAAELRTGIADTTANGKTGPYGLTQTQWDADGDGRDVNLEIVMPATGLSNWRMQCLFAALGAYRAQNAILDKTGAFPSAMELYREQWPDDPVSQPSDLGGALNRTAALVGPAEREVLGAAPAAPVVIAKPTDPPVIVVPDPAVPMPTANEELFSRKSPWIMAKLMDDFELTDFQAAGILGNIGHECAGFRLMQEQGVTRGRGGFGWCQWTASRRVAFETFCSDRGLKPTSDEANYGYLKQELSTTEKGSIAALRKATTLPEAVRVFEKNFERAKIKHYDRRDRWATLALGPFKKMLPSEVSRLVDPDAQYAVVSRAKTADARYWVVDEFSESGGQVLIRQVATGTVDVLLRDTTVFPLPAAIVTTITKAVAEELSRTVVPGAADGPDLESGSDDSKRRLLAQAKACDGILVTRKVPGTNGGRLACAWAVNEVARRALGSPIGGGLSTALMAGVLRKKHNPVKRGDLAAGLVIISPTEGKRTGHVGIVGEIANPISATPIYSNSSRLGKFDHRFSLGSWEAYYGKNLGLSVQFFAIA